jgi:hypothetical protein
VAELIKSKMELSKKIEDRKALFMMPFVKEDPLKKREEFAVSLRKKKK